MYDEFIKTSQQTYEVGTIIISNLPMIKMRHKEIIQLINKTQQMRVRM